MPRISKQSRQLSVYEVEICYRFTNITSVANLKSFHFKPELLVGSGGGGEELNEGEKAWVWTWAKCSFTKLCSIPSPPFPHFVQSPLPPYHTLFSPLSSFTTLCSVPSLTLPHFVQSPLSLYHTLFSPLSLFTTLCSISSPPFPHFVQSSPPHLTCLFLKFKEDFFKALWKSS